MFGSWIWISAGKPGAWIGLAQVEANRQAGEQVAPELFDHYSCALYSVLRLTDTGNTTSDFRELCVLLQLNIAPKRQTEYTQFFI